MIVSIPRVLIIFLLCITGCGRFERTAGVTVSPFSETHDEASWGDATCRIDTTTMEKYNKAIYGDDNRRDWSELESSPWLKVARSTVALMRKVSEPMLNADLSEFFPTLRMSMNLCQGERFANQVNPAFCSGFLVGPNLVVTAGHCIESQSDCDSTDFVFDFAKTPNNPQARIQADNVYACESIVQSETGQNDYAVVRLARPVLDRDPLPIRREDAVTVGEKLVLIGHPSGLPSKIVRNGEAQRVETEVILASVDAFGGNSGSVIVNQETGLVEGILVAGGQDYSEQNGCMVAHQCNGDCNGEVITSIALTKNLIPEPSSSVDLNEEEFVDEKLPICDASQEGVSEEPGISDQEDDQPAGAPEQSKCESGLQDSEDGRRKQLCELVNRDRTTSNLLAIELDDQLNQVAQAYAKKMADENFFSHVSPNGSGPSDRLEAGNVSYRAMGENIFFGSQSPSQAHSGWMNSSGHRANILNGSFEKMGLGQYQGYWVQVFIRENP